MATQSGLELAARVCQLEEGDVAIRVADKAVLGGRVVSETRGPRVERVGADAARVVRRMKGEVFVATRGEHPVVLKRVVNACNARLVSFFLFCFVLFCFVNS